MTPITVAAYIADVWILFTYFALARWKANPWHFHLANAFGCIPLIATEIAARAYAPMVLTVAFGAIGWVGLSRGRR